jgi:hypothetical protein
MVYCTLARASKRSIHFIYPHTWHLVSWCTHDGVFLSVVHQARLGTAPNLEKGSKLPRIHTLHIAVPIPVPSFMEKVACFFFAHGLHQTREGRIPY